MTLGEEEQTLLRQTAKATAVGDYLRRFWLPVATVADLNDERRAKRVRILSEGLVLFRDRSGRAALIPERCPHEGASMLMGAINNHGITCMLHGWFFDTERMCSVWEDDSVSAQGYPAREHAGLYWAYFGQAPEPPLPAAGLLGSQPAQIRVAHYPPLRANWLLEVPKHLHAGPLWLLTPIDREQTLVFSLEAASSGDGTGELEIVAGEAIEPDPGHGPTVAGDLLAPWDSIIPTGSAHADLIQIVQRQIAPTADSAQI